jgi:hypothetical protein
MVEHTSNPSTQEAEVGESRAPVQPGVHNETVLKKKKKERKEKPTKQSKNQMKKVKNRGSLEGGEGRSR